MHPSRIYIAGFMGSGKSTIGKIVANVRGMDFIDLDAEIVNRAGCSIPEIFAMFGEARFREMEYETLVDASKKKNVIISLGGGAFLPDRNRQVIQASGLSVFLRVPIECLVLRLMKGNGRPLLTQEGGKKLDEEALRAKISALYEKRKDVYEKADLIVDTDGLRVGSAVDLVAREIRRYLRATKTQKDRVARPPGTA